MVSALTSEPGPVPVRSAFSIGAGSLVSPDREPDTSRSRAGRPTVNEASTRTTATSTTGTAIMRIFRRVTRHQTRWVLPSFLVPGLGTQLQHGPFVDVTRAMRIDAVESLLDPPDRNGSV